MYENFKGIDLSGEMFDKVKSGKSSLSGANLSIIYGRNGLGKSTIAKGFKEHIDDDDIVSLAEAELIDQNDLIINSTNEIKKSIFMFDEDLIDRNIRIK